MFKLKSLDKKGFGHVEIIIFIVVILAIGGIGYFALKGSRASSTINTCNDIVYKQGSSQTPCVGFIQRMLNGLNRVDERDKNEIVTVDGLFNSSTKAAVIRFQDRQGYQKSAQDGVVDKGAWNALCRRAINVYFGTKYITNSAGTLIDPREKSALDAVKAGKRAGCANEDYKAIEGTVYKADIDKDSDINWERLAQCESGGNWQAVSSTTPKYYGGLQFSLSSWQGVGGEGRPDQATKAEQIKRGRILKGRANSWSPWHNCAASLNLTPN